jgi:malate dehydrogenase
LHIAQVGTGRVGRPTAYSIINSGIVNEITLCDVKPGLAKAFAQEIGHVTSSINQHIQINYCEKNDEVNGADIILISAGKPRTPGIKMSRRDLAFENAKIIKHIADVTPPNNPDAKYIVISNPVDAMAMIFKKYSKENFVISTGTNLESLRFRYELSKQLNVPVSEIQGWVGGEHGIGAIPLWSTVNIKNTSLKIHLLNNNQVLYKNLVLSYVKSVSKLIIDNIGGTEYGPAASFRDITMAIAKDSKKILSIAAPIKLEEFKEPIHVGIPTCLGKKIGSSIYDKLSFQEKLGILDAAKAIYSTYISAIEYLEKGI